MWFRSHFPQNQFNSVLFFNIFILFWISKASGKTQSGFVKSPSREFKIHLHNWYNITACVLTFFFLRWELNFCFYIPGVKRKNCSTCMKIITCLRTWKYVNDCYRAFSLIYFPYLTNISAVCNFFTLVFLEIIILFKK